MMGFMIQVAQKKVKIAFENADSSSRVELIPSKIKYANKATRRRKKSFRQRDEKKGKSDQKCFRCGDLNHLIGDFPKSSRNKDQKAFIEGSWSDSENDAEVKTNDETCLMAQSSNEVCLRKRLEPDEWIKDSGCSKYMIGNKSLFSTYKAYDESNVVFGSNLKGKIIGKVEESLNVTFNESPPPTKLSPLVDDDVSEEEAVRKKTKIVNTSNEEDEWIEVNKVINIKESKNHPLDQIKQMKDKIFFNQPKYIKEMLRKFGLEDSKPTKTSMSMEIKLTKEMKLTPWIALNIEKQTALAISMTEAEYVSAEKACQQALLMKQALIDYGIHLDDVLIMFIFHERVMDPLDILRNPSKEKGKKIVSSSIISSSSSSADDNEAPSFLEFYDELSDSEDLTKAQREKRGMFKCLNHYVGTITKYLEKQK
nr:retrotransposon protein [Tanacetum cinerariifolium]